MVRVVMNCATFFCFRLMYTYNSPSPTSFSAFVIGEYSHPPSICRFGIFPVIRRTTWWWNPPPSGTVPCGGSPPSFMTLRAVSPV